MGKGHIFHFMLHEGCQGDFQIVRGFDAHADGQTALRVGIHQQNSLAGLGKAHAEIDCCGCLANTAILVGDGNDLCALVFHLLSIEIKKAPVATTKGGNGCPFVLLQEIMLTWLRNWDII